MVVAGTGLFVLSGCTAPLPDVGFYGNRTSVSSGPSLWCTVDQGATAAACSIDLKDAAAARLSVGAGQGVVISVPKDIADQPWTVVFRYTDTGGSHDARTAVFDPHTRFAYTLDPPAGAQLTRVEVQSGLTLVQGGSGSGGVDVAVLRSWVLVVNPSGAVT